MKIAVASSGKNENSSISARAGRAPYYVIFSETGKVLEIMRNPLAKGGGGAGPAVAQMLSEREVNIVIAGAIGDNMAYALDTKDITFAESKGQVYEAASKYFSE